MLKQDLRHENALPSYCFTVNTFNLEKLKEERQFRIHNSFNKNVYQSIDLTTFSFGDVLKMAEHFSFQEKCLSQNDCVFNVYTYGDLLNFMCQHLIYSKKDMMFDTYFFDFIYLATTPDLLQWGIQHDYGSRKFGESKIFGKKSSKIVGNLNDGSVKLNKKIPVIDHQDFYFEERCCPTQIPDFLDNYAFFRDNVIWALVTSNQTTMDLFFDAVKIITPHCIICDPTKIEVLGDEFEKKHFETLKPISKYDCFEHISVKDIEKIKTYLELQ